MQVVELPLQVAHELEQLKQVEGDYPEGYVPLGQPMKQVLLISYVSIGQAS